MTSFHDLPEELLPRIDEENYDEASIEATTASEPATVFGYACKYTPASLPLPIWLAHRLARRLAEARRSLDYLSPDGKTQVAIEYKGLKPSRVDGLTLVACQKERREPSAARLSSDLRERVIEPVLADCPVRADSRTRLAINPDGPLSPGGPVLHAGLTGRKTAVDGYGAFARHGAAALSGKDPSRIDRIGSYAARHAARHVVMAGLAERCEIQLSYSIGLARPVSVIVETFGTGSEEDAKLAARVSRVFDFRLAAIVRNFGLRSLPARRQGTFYRALASYGHVGREELDLPWERLDKLAQLRD
jgi:S-adenosylmethionine synthetase